MIFDSKMNKKAGHYTNINKNTLEINFSEQTFIGKRKSKVLFVQTFHLINKDTKMSNNRNNQHHNRHHHNHRHLEYNDPEHDYTNVEPLTNNAMTMQTALETAYKDWNKNKTSSESSSGNETSSTTATITQQEQQMEESSSSSSSSMRTKSDVNQRDEEDSQSQKKLSSNESSYNSSTRSSPAKTAPVPAPPAPPAPPLVVKEIQKNSQYQKSMLNDTSITTTTAIPAASTTASSKLTTEIPYFFGNPTVDIVKGFLHIYKDSYILFLFFIYHTQKKEFII